MCARVFMLTALSKILSAPIEQKHSFSFQPFSFAFFHVVCRDVFEMVQNHNCEVLSVSSVLCRCFSTADQHSSEEEHLCGDSLLDGTRGIIKLPHTEQ